jgi:WD40 repeat protein
MPVLKHRNKKWKTIILIVLLLVACVLIYYQFLYKSTRIDNGMAKLEDTFSAHTGAVWTAKFSPDGSTIVSAGIDSTVKVWNRENRTIIHNLKHPAGVTCAVFSPDGKYIASSSYDAKIRVWDLSSGKLLKELNGHSNTAWCVAFSPDGKTIASSGEDATIKLWDVTSGNLIRSLQGHTLTVWAVKFSPDRSKIASGSFDKTVKIWDATNGKLLKTIDGHTEAIVDVAFSHDGQQLASTSDDKTIKVWNVSNGALIRSFEVPEHIQAAAFSPDDKRLLTGGRDKPAIGEFLQNFLGDSKLNKGVSMRLWDVQTGELLQTFEQHANDVNDVSFSADGKWIASASSDKTVQVWRLLK